MPNVGFIALTGLLTVLVAGPAMADPVKLSVGVLPDGAKVESAASLSAAHGEIGGFTFYFVDGGYGILVADLPGVAWTDLSRRNGWFAYCDIDALTDEKSCGIERSAEFEGKSKLGLMIIDGFVCSSTDYPGKGVAFRVDKGTVFQDQGKCLDAAKSKALISEVLQGDQLIVRNYFWPYDYPQDAKVSLKAFREALAMRDWIAQQATAGRLSP